MKIALRISASKLSPLTFDNTVSDDYQYLFETISCLPAIVNTSEVQGVLNNGRNYSNLLYSHKEHEVIISSNELTDEAIEFIKSFWTAKFKYISRYENAWTDYVGVLTTGGVFPIEYIEGNIQLPEIKLILKETKAIGA